MTSSGAPTVWQIACGDSDRDYSGLFVQFDLMFVGPGDPGEFGRARYEPVVPRALTARKLGAIQDFCEAVKPGDIILLRKRHRVVDVGVAHDEGYIYDEAFDDVDGWDLQHTRRVVWQEHLKPELEALQSEGGLFGHRGQIPMFTRVNDNRVRTPLLHLFDHLDGTREPKPRPSGQFETLRPDEVAEQLFTRGLSNQATEQVLEALERQRRLLRWYLEHGKASHRPQEHEVVAHMVLPLLLALGWSEQLLAVEWNRIDLAGFRTAPTTAEDCVLVCEAKGLSRGLDDGVLTQAKTYVERLQLRSCQKILLSQGGRFYLFEKGSGGWSSVPSGYLNVEKVRLEHLTPQNTNGIDTLMGLSPLGVTQPMRRDS